MKIVSSTAFVGFVMSLLIASSSVSAQNACKAETDALKTNVEAVTAKYKPQIDKLSTDAQARAKKIQDDNPPPSAAGAVLKFDIKVTSHDQEFKFGLPSATLKTQALSWDSPTVTKKLVKWSWDVPEFGSHMECTNGVPETVCTPLVCSLPTCNWGGCSGGGCSGGECKLRAGNQICTKVPDVKMVTKEASMDVPEVKMNRVDVKLDIPEFTIVQQRYVITVPDFTLVNVSYQETKTQDASKQLEKDTEAQAAVLTKQMKGDITLATAAGLNLVFGCNENFVKSQRDKVTLDLDTKIGEMKQSASDARTQNNQSLGAAIDASINQMLLSRVQVIQQFEVALQNLRSARDKALAESAAM